MSESTEQAQREKRDEAHDARMAALAPLLARLSAEYAPTPAPMLGTNVSGNGAVTGLEYVEDPAASAEENEDRYRHTPTFDADSIPRGRTVHVGRGVWLRRCSECDDYALLFGAHWSSTIARHNTEHGVPVAGVNVGMLP